MSTLSGIAKTACIALVVPLALAGCGSSAVDKPAAASSNAMDQGIHNALPQTIRDAGVIQVVISGTRPPIWMTTPGQADGNFIGAGAELMDAVGEIMGVHINLVSNPDVPGAFAAISAGRYAFGFPYADLAGTPKARPDAEFVDVLQDVVPFLVKAGNPKGISSMDTLCDVTVAASANAQTYQVAEQQAKKCRASGKDLNVLSIDSIPNGVLAVKSGRADAFFSQGAPLFYAAKESKGEFEVVGAQSDNGFGVSYLGALLPKGSDLTQPLLSTFQKLFDNGQYEKIMKKWSLDVEIIQKPGINLYSKLPTK